MARVEKIWRVEYSNRLFTQLICIRGTKKEMQKYMESKFGYLFNYRAFTNKELEAIEILDLPIYTAPRLT